MMGLAQGLEWPGPEAFGVSAVRLDVIADSGLGRSVFGFAHGAQGLAG